MDVEVAGAGHETAGADAARGRGRATSSPPQFGQTPSISSVHETQKVHSNVQMRASPSGDSAVPQRSHSVRISSAIRGSVWDEVLAGTAQTKQFARGGRRA